MLRPVSLDTLLTAAMMRSVRFGPGMKSFDILLFMRPGSPGEAEEPPCPWYLPVNTPPASGDHAVTPIFNALAIGISSRSTVRSIRLYSICNPTKGDHPRRWASVFACAIHQAGASEMPV